MANTFLLVAFVVSLNLIVHCQAQPPWVLKRSDPGSKAISFYNNTVTDAYMLARWTWWDSSGGFWDTRLRVTLSKEDLIGGGFTYSDQHGNELVSVRWFKMNIDRPIRWKYTSYASAPDSWWMTSVIPQGNLTWGFKNQIDGSWVFKVGNDTLEPKNSPSFDGWPQQNMGDRWKRSLKLHQNNVKSLQMNEPERIKYRDSDDCYDDDSVGGENLFEMIIGYLMEIFQMFNVG